MCEFEIVIFDCATFIQFIDNNILCHIFPVDIENFQQIEKAYDTLRTASAITQETVLAKVQEISRYCKQFY